MAPTSKINANGVEIGIIGNVADDESFICLTDIARYRNQTSPADVVKNWMRLRSTIEFLGLWEQLHNSNFNMVDFDHFKTEAGSNAFTLSPQQWITSTNAIQKYLISKCLSDEEKQYTFANAADLLNVALFGKRAYEWRNMNPDKAKKGENIRDYASAEELIVLINLENFNAEWISQGLSQAERLEKLRTVAYSQLEIFQKNAAKRKLTSVNQRLLKGGDANAN